MENLTNSNHAKTDGTIRMIFECLTAKFELKFGDNRLKARGATWRSIWEDFGKKCNYARIGGPI